MMQKQKTHVKHVEMMPRLNSLVFPGLDFSGARGL